MITAPTRRFLKYLSVGASTLAFDLLILFFLTSVLGWNYILSAGIAFLIAISVNYLFSRRYVFRDTLRSAHSGYFLFILIASAGLVIVVSLMALFVEVFRLDVIAARVIVACFVGVWNYVMNFYVNFKIHQVEQDEQKEKQDKK